MIAAHLANLNIFIGPKPKFENNEQNIVIQTFVGFSYFLVWLNNVQNTNVTFPHIRFIFIRDFV